MLSRLSFAPLLLVLLSSCSSGTSPLDDKASSDAQQGSGEYLSQYDWKRISQTKLPKVVANGQSPASTGMSLTQDRRCHASSAREFKDSFRQLADTVLKVPEVKLCNGADVEVGVTYLQVPAGATGIARQSLPLLRYEERQDFGVVHMNCAQTGGLMNVTTYKFGEGTSFRTEYYAEYYGERNYGLFDKNLTNADEFVSQYLSVGQDRAMAFKATYRTDGTGGSKSFDWTPQDQSGRAVLFGEIGGGSIYQSNSSEGSRVYREFFDASGYRASSLELAGLDLSSLSAVTPPATATDAEFTFPETLSGLTCGTAVVEVECTDTQPKSMAGGEAGPSVDCVEDVDIKVGSSNHIEILVNDQYGSRDPYVLVDTSLMDYTDLDSLVEGEIFGLRASFTKADGAVTDITDRLVAKVEETDGLIAVYQPTGCDALSEDSQTQVKGSAFSNADACQIAKRFPLLLQVRKAGQVEIPFTLVTHSASLRFTAKAAVPLHVLVTRADADVGPDACAPFMRAPAGGLRQTNVSLPADGNREVWYALHACKSDGTVVKGDWQDLELRLSSGHVHREANRMVLFAKNATLTVESPSRGRDDRLAIKQSFDITADIQEVIK